ncbi:MAG: Hsp20/alpha crystallin family protein [Verrucomicrobiota bacterium]
MNQNQEQLVTTQSVCDPTPAPSTAPRATRRPHYTVRESEGAYEVGVALPGVTKEDVRVSFEDQQLVLAAKWKNETPDNWKPLYRELSEADYRLVLDIQFEVDAEGISARMEEGILSLRLPLAESAKPKTIAIH